MKTENIQELLSFIASSNLDEVNIETEGFKLSVKRNAAPQAQIMMQAPMAAQAPMMPQAQAEGVAPVLAATAPTAPAANLANMVTQKSPMIGTFYAAASPDQPPLAKVGDTVTKGQIICIVEAMKLFNEIEADFDGVITQVLVQNATPVEYDQPLFILESN